jgi:hypothetical protein
MGRSQALKAIDRITGINSELSSLREGSEDWGKAVADPHGTVSETSKTFY